MKRRFFQCVMVVLVALTACASPTNASPTQLSSSDQVATVVAATMQAFPSDTPVAATLETPTELLPQSLYYLGRDSNTGLIQVFRMERDGKTVTQITNEENLREFDVSPVDGSLALISYNQLILQLILVNADGSNRRVLADSGSQENTAWIRSPVFSPDGQTLAYSNKGLYLFDISTGVSNLEIEAPSFGSYLPAQYSPDGTKLLVEVPQWEAPNVHAVYYLDTNVLMNYAEVQDYINCCSYHGDPVWSSDSLGFYGVASVHDSSYQYGELWRIDAGNGAVTRMLQASGGTLNLPKEPYLAPDGQLYFFFGTYRNDAGFWDAPVLSLVRSAPDGVTDRTVLRNENFVLMNEALWAPDASLVIVAMASRRDSDGVGVLELYYTDAQKGMVWLAPSGYQMKWGP